MATLLALWLALAACATGWIAIQRSIDHTRNRWPQAYPLLFLPSGQYLRATSFGYRIVMADLIYLWSIQYYGHRRTPEGRAYLWHIYDVITELDPGFVDAYLIGGLIMSSDMSDPEMAVRLLEKGMESNEDTWILPLDAGFYCYLDLEDYARAATYFERAMKIPGAPPEIGRLRATMFQMAGDLLKSLQFWVEIYQGATDEWVKSIAWQHIRDLRVKLDIRQIEAAIRRYQDERGRLPPSVGALLAAGYLYREPVSPDGVPYTYDPSSGAVSDPRAGQRRGAR